MIVEKVKLGSVAKVLNGYAFKSNEYVDDGIRIIRITNVQKGQIKDDDPKFIDIRRCDEFSRYLLANGDILISLTGNVGRVGVIDESMLPAALNQRVGALKIGSGDIEPDYLFHVLNSETFENDAIKNSKGIAQLNLSSKWIEDYQIPLPPLAEQKRIAAILDTADTLRAKRRESLAQLDTLLHSTFLDLFGDPVTNPKGWKVEALDNWLENIDSGWSPKCLGRKAQHNEWGILKLGAVTWCEFDETEQKALPPDVAPRQEAEVKQGDLLFSRKNTYDLVAAAAYVHNVRPRLMLPDLIFRLRLKPDAKVEPKFLWKLLTEKHQRETIQKLAGGAAGSMPNISKAKLKTVELIKPPLDLQRRFATIVESVEQQKARLRDHLTELDTLFASLQHRAFNGEL